MTRGLRAAGWVALLGAVSLLADGLAGQAGAATGQPSANVLVIPGFQAPHYRGFVGVPVFPTDAPGLAGYHFSQLAAGAVTPAAFQGFDTIVLYGQRWTDLSANAQSAINGFAQTGKVVIWDADATGSQNYSSFVHPFSTTASGEVKGAQQGSAVTFPTAADPLASPDPANPLYLNPNALTASNDLIQDMSVLDPGAPDWSPGLIAANQIIPSGGWTLAWAYGSTANQTGMTIYSGMDADAFSETVTPNYAQKELAIELASPFQRTPVAACAPGCSPPPTSGGGSTGGSTQSGLGSPGSPTFAMCSFARRPPVSWVHRRVALLLRTSFANGVRAQALTATGKVVASGVPTATGDLRLAVNTRLLPSNRKSKLLAVVNVNSVRACSVSTHLNVDNTPPRLLLLKLGRAGSARLLTLRTSERVQLSILLGRRTLRTKKVGARTTVRLTLPSERQPETLVLTDRAGNRTIHSLGCSARSEPLRRIRFAPRPAGRRAGLAPGSRCPIPAHCNSRCSAERQDARMTDTEERDAGVVIAGGGLAAQRCAETLRRLGYEGRIRIVCAEPRAPYDRPPLSKQVLADADAEQRVGYRPPEWYDDKRVELMLDTRAAGLDVPGRRLLLAGGEELRYRDLVIATGSAPRTLAAFAAYENASTLRTLEDAHRLRDLLAARARLLIVGAGFIGQEVAAAWRAGGAEVAVVEAEPLPLRALLGEQIGAWFAALHEREGVELVLGQTVAEVHGSGRLGAVTLDDGRRLEADHVLLGVGVRPDLRWLEGSPLPIEGIPTDAGGRSGVPDVYAAGDAAAFFDPFLGRHALSGHWESAGRQGASVAGSIVGQPAAAPALSSFWSDQYGTRIQYLGHAPLADEVAIDGDLDARDFVALYSRDGVAVAALIVGRPKALPELRERLSHLTERSAA